MTQPGLERHLGTGDAVVIGLCAMVGAGVFIAFAPAAQAAGAGLLAGLAIAAAVAFCNAASSAQLAMAHPSSGGTYLFGRVVLGPWWGFLAGWGFVIGKTASCAAMAMTFATYALPDVPTWWHRLLAVAAVVALTAANLRGITRTALVARMLLGTTLLTLGLVLIVCFANDVRGPDPWSPTGSAGPVGVLQSAGLLFFAFAGYARIATLAEEVRRPQMLGRAILIALGIAITIYALVAVSLLLVLGTGLADSPTPVAEAAEAAGGVWAGVIVRISAMAACLGALLALLAGVGRTTLAMARERDLPMALASVDPRHHVPDRAQIVIAGAIITLICLTDIRTAIGFSSFGVLIYYAITNLAAFHQPAAERRWPRAVNVAGLSACLALALTLPLNSVLTATTVLLIGIIGRFTQRRREQRARP